MANRTLVHETASNPGTGVTINLAGAVASRRSFASSFASGATCFYIITDGTQSEWGIGTFTAGAPNTLARTTVVGNSAATTSRLNFTGAINVYNAIPGEYGVYSGSIVGGNAGGSANALTATTPISYAAAVPEGTEVSVYATAANTGNATLNVNGEGALPLRRSNNTEFPAGLIQADDMLRVVRYGSTWRSLPRADDDIIGILAPSAAGSVDLLLPTKYNFFSIDALLSFSTDTSFLAIKTSTNSGSSYDTGASDYTSSYEYMNTTTTLLANTSNNNLMICSAGTDSGAASSFLYRGLFYPGDGTKYPTVKFSSGGLSDIGGGAFLGVSSNTAIRSSATRVNAIRFLPNAGTFTGKITVRGIY